MTTQNKSGDVYQIITDTIIKKLEEGQIPWKQPWTSQLPVNLVSNRTYSGINLLLLSISGFTSPYWMTYKQAHELGGTVKSGSKGTPVIFWKILEYNSRTVEGKDGKTEVVTDEVPLLRYYTVFNLDQTEGVKLPKHATTISKEFNPIEEAEKIVNDYTTKPTITYSTEGRAYFRPSTDVLTMPNKETFNSEPEYYSTLFHELTHSTGVKTRLNRYGDGDSFHFGNELYSKEELVAELGSAYLSAEAHISNQVIDNQAGYIQNWLKALKDDKKLLVHASAKANHSTQYILGKDKEGE